MQALPTIRRALLTLFDKQDVVPFAQALLKHDIELLSTGGTAQALRHAGLAVTEIATYTGYPEMMGGRVKTLHPKVHGAILGRRDQDQAVMEAQGIVPIDLVVANFYPFAESVADPASSLEQVIENIDIGGPALVRSAAKNYQAVAVVIDPADYPQLLSLLAEHQGALPLAYRFGLATKAFAYVADYDRQIAYYLSQQTAADPLANHPAHAQPVAIERFPQQLSLHYSKQQTLRYGENPHQRAALYQALASRPLGIAGAQQLQGKRLSYNNLVDADSAFSCVQVFEQAACVIVKHANPCGVALADTLLQAYQSAFKSDPTSAFGGIIALNRPLEIETAHAILAQQFVEVIVAPAVTADALECVAKKSRVRLLMCDNISAGRVSFDYKCISGGLLIQETDSICLRREQLKVVTSRQPNEREWQDLLFAWKVAKFVKSNAMVYAKGQVTLGIGAGQMSRIDAAKIAVMKAAEAGLILRGSVLAADAFLPFCDTIDHAATTGVSCVIQPGGSMRDDEIIDSADQQGIAMVFTGVRHFRH